MIKETTHNKSLQHHGQVILIHGEILISHGVVVETNVAEWVMPILLMEGLIFTLMPLLLGLSSVVQAIKIVPVLTNARVNICLFSLYLLYLIMIVLDVMHWIESTPTNIQAYGLCSKDSYATLRLENGTEIVTANGFTGSWPNSGGDVGRYTA